MLGYEDINHYEYLRRDPVFGYWGEWQWRIRWRAKSTLNRMELGTGAKDHYKKITFWKGYRRAVGVYHDCAELV